MDFANLSLTSIKLCSPVIVFIVYVIVSGVSLFMSRNTLKRFNDQKMENLYNLYSWSEVKLVIVLGVVIYGLCQYDQMNLAWLFLLLPVIYIMLKNILVYYSVSIAHQNAPKEPEDLVKQVLSPSVPSPGASVYPKPPVVKKEVDTSIFGMRGDPESDTKPIINIPPTAKREEAFTGPDPVGSPPGGPPSSNVDELLGAGGNQWIDQFGPMR